MLSSNKKPLQTIDLDNFIYINTRTDTKPISQKNLVAKKKLENSSSSTDTEQKQTNTIETQQSVPTTDQITTSTNINVQPIEIEASIKSYPLDVSLAQETATDFQEKPNPLVKNDLTVTSVALPKEDIPESNTHDQSVRQQIKSLAHNIIHNRESTSTLPITPPQSQEQNHYPDEDENYKIDDETLKSIVKPQEVTSTNEAKLDEDENYKIDDETLKSIVKPQEVTSTNEAKLDEDENYKIDDETLKSIVKPQEVTSTSEAKLDEDKDEKIISDSLQEESLQNHSLNKDLSLPSTKSTNEAKPNIPTTQSQQNVNDYILNIETPPVFSTHMTKATSKEASILTTTTPNPSHSPQTKPSSFDKLDVHELDKESLRKMMAYLDNLFDQLPPSTIEDFSKSEYFNLYHKILQKLELL